MDWKDQVRREYENRDEIECFFENKGALVSYHAYNHDVMFIFSFEHTLFHLLITVNNKSEHYTNGCSASILNRVFSDCATLYKGPILEFDGINIPKVHSRSKITST
jgi:hypothetical protein